MPLAPGTRLGPYEIVAAIGAGGMGEVYRARDTRLDRDVALKVLPQSFAGDSDRLMRFEREAKTLASLNHPHIAQIYGLEEARSATDPQATRALVMELIDGEDLSARIARGALPLDDLLSIARQIAEALEAAHEAGLVHRDLKPANVKVRADGTVKVLDFGLAKARVPGSAEASELSTITSPAITGQGIILGTAAYMSPEQARGHVVDKRADIWAFGCVLFEMLTRRRAFGGEEIAGTLTAILRDEPAWDALPVETPPALRRVLERALRKDPRRRLRDAGDARIEIETAREELTALPAVMSRVERPRALVPAWVLAAIAVIVFAAAAVVWSQRGRATTEGWTATEIGGPRIAFLPRLSPDGRLLAWIALASGQSQLGVMDTSSADWSLLTTEPGIGSVIDLAWAADGSRIYFGRFSQNGRRIYSVSPLGGDPRLVLENAFAPQPLEDGSLLFLRFNSEGLNQLHRFWPQTGQIRELPVHVHAAFTHSLRAFPGGREAAVFGRLLTPDGPGPFGLMVLDLGSGAARTLATGADVGGFVGSEDVVPIGVSRDGATVLTTKRLGSSSQVVAFARDGSPARPLFTTTRLIVAIEEGPDGGYYVDQLDRSMEHLRMPVTGGVPERLAAGMREMSSAGALALGDGRFVYATVIGGRSRLVAGRAGEELLPFVDTQEDARAPLARLSDREFAFVAGTLERPVLAIADSSSGRVLRRLEKTRGRVPRRLAVAADGVTIYFAADERIWSVPAGDGEVREVTRGNAVAPDPGGRFLIVERQDAGGVHLVRRDAGGTETRLSLPAGIRATGLSVWSRSLDARGRLAFVVESDDSWFWRPAVFDLATNQVTRIPLVYSGDTEVDTAWEGDRITVLARRMESSIWRFDRVKD